MSFSEESGDVTTESQDIILSVTNLEDVYMGNYQETILFDSNGGSNSFQVMLELKYSGISIFPGESVAGVSILGTYSDLKNKHGDPEGSQLGIVQLPEGMTYLHIKKYNSIGLSFWFFSSTTTLKTTDLVLLINAKHPFGGYTEKGICISSTLSDVINAYGEAEKIDEQYNSYRYSSKGITFYTDDNKTVVEEITITSPSNPLLKKQMLHNMEHLN